MIAGLSNIFVGVLFIAISLPLVMGKIPMNSFCGVRFKKSYESEENWYKINRYGGQQLIIWSIVLVILGVSTIFSPIKESHGFTSISLCAPLIVLIPAFKSYMYSKKL
jgi:uncharacterized membrane protein